MNKIHWDSILMPVIGIVLGIYLLVRPWSATSTLCLLIGWLVFGAGVVGVLNALLFQRETLVSAPGLPVSVAAAVVGLYFITNPGSLVELVGLIICVFLLIEGIVNMQNAVQHKRWGDSLWWVPLAVGVVCVALGLMALFAPWSYTNLIMRIVGALLIFSGVVNLILAFLVKE
ncbi:MAG: HdeD family acid-resistance protein [Gemmiger sp.]